MTRYMKCPVIAVASGGPLETVEHESTGYLCDQIPAGFADALFKFTTDANLKQKLGQSGYDSVVKMFPFDAFTQQLHDVVVKLYSLYICGA